MANQTNSSPAMYALLIGIDCYLPNRLPNGGCYASLNGCVRDIYHVTDFLQYRLDVPQERIVTLTATNTGAQEPPEPREQWPTYEAMVTAFKRVSDMAQPGDQVYIHYSGHGGRASTIYPQLKGPAGLDEALVPTDIGNSEARYMRDVELAKLLNDMVGKGLVVAVVLDSCQSGGMTRGQGKVAAVRGAPSIDTAPRPAESLVGAPQELAETWGRLMGSKTRDVKLGSAWLPEPKGYTLLAACRPSESACEWPFANGEWSGALTYWLLDSLQDIGPGLSYKVLHDRIVAKVHSQFEGQTPQLQGEGDRAVFGSERVQPYYAVTVMQVDAPGGRLLLGAGQAHGLRKGAQFAVYPRGTTDFAALDKRQGLAEISALGATDSWATLTEQFGEKAVEQGAQAVLIGANSVGLIRKVSWESRAGLDPAVGQAVKQAVAGSGWLEMATGGEEVTFQVAVNEQGEYEIRDGAGQAIKNLRPAVKSGAPNAAADVVRRLVHLAKYRAIQQLSNHDPLSPLARKLAVELVGKREEYDPADRFEARPFDDPGHTPALKIGEWTGLRIKNETAQALNVTVFDLQPDWGATQIYPPGAGDNFVAFDPGQEVVLPLQANLPDGYSQGTDVLKVFATLGTTNFRWLELPPMDQPLSRSATVRGAQPDNPLEAMLAAFTADRPPTRNLVPAAYPSKEWITAEVEVRIQRPE